MLCKIHALKGQGVNFLVQMEEHLIFFLFSITIPNASFYDFKL